MSGRWQLVVIVCLTAVPVTLLAQAGTPIVHRGALASGDQQLHSGEYYDSYEVQGRAGQRVVFDLTSTAFDPYLMVIAPSGHKDENDDYRGSNTRSRLELALEETGTYRVVVTSYTKDETGAYELRIGPGGPAAAEPGVRTESGRLAAGDSTLRTGEYRDAYTFQGRRGQLVTVDLRSADFDPYLIVIDPSGKHHENDDHEGDSHRSLVSYELLEDGAYRILVTSHRSGETGAYDLRIQTGTAGGAVAGAAARGGPRVERGRLAVGDDTLRTGEYVDAYTFDGRPGQRVTVVVESNDFDTYLMLIPPRGDRWEDDDVEGKPHHSVIEADLTEPGQYRVAVTSYKRGETGAYELHIDFGAATAESPTARQPRDVQPIAYGETQTGALSTDDARLSTGEYRDLYAFDGSAGDSIVVELASSAFDPYLILIPPQGEQIDNDDADGRQDLSRVTVTLRAGGRYRIEATSYEAQKTGSYQLTLRRATGAAPGPVVTEPPRPAAAGQRVFGVFVGISEYADTENNLPYTADDARRMYQAMQRGAGMRATDGVLLVDRQATLAAVRQAIQRVGGEAGPNDMFVLFYSGHGGRETRQTFQPADPDGLDETLVFYDAEITDDALNELLGGVHARVTLVVLDACFSGGFSKDVISAPGRMGLFSSEEDVLSSVAVKFRAGGYLADFVAEAVGDRLADADRDGEITAIELSQYLHERYRSDVKSGGRGDTYVRTGGPQTGYQHLVVDRGSVGPYDVLFR